MSEIGQAKGKDLRAFSRGNIHVHVLILIVVVEKGALISIRGILTF
jgi:hypothetical protein